MKNEFCKRLKVLRQENELTQAQLATILGLKKQNISDWENGRSQPSLFLFVKLAKYFDVTTDYLLGLTEAY